MAAELTTLKQFSPKCWIGTVAQPRPRRLDGPTFETAELLFLILIVEIKICSQDSLLLSISCLKLLKALDPDYAKYT